MKAKPERFVYIKASKHYACIMYQVLVSYSIIILCILLFASCEKGKEVITPDNNDVDSIKSFDVDLAISELIYYPNDSISLTFSVNPTKGIAPYVYEWINTKTFVGEGPFTMNIVDSIVLEVNITDSENTKVNFRHHILRDTIDPLKYDYRNVYIGFYKCDVTHCYSFTICESYKDTIEIAKHEDFSMLQVSHLIHTSDVDFYFINSTFSGYHIYGIFNSDSIYMLYTESPIHLSSWEYTGKKLYN